MSVKTTSQGVLHSQIWSLSGGLWPGDGSSKKVRGGGDILIHVFQKQTCKLLSLKKIPNCFRVAEV